MVGNICIPTIAYCNEMDKILNDEYECESCEFYEERVENECLIRCDDDTQMRDPDDKNSCICVDDFVDDGHGNCIPIPDCGVNERLENNSCVCVDGYVDEGGVCVLQCGDNEERQDNGACDCVSDYERYDGICVPECAVDKERINGVCVSQCGDNEARQVNGECGCADGYEHFDGACAEECSDGEMRDLSDGTCFDLMERECELDGQHHWMPQSEVCVDIPPLDLVASMPLSFLQEYHDSEGNMDARHSSEKNNLFITRFAVKASRHNVDDWESKFLYLADNTDDIGHEGANNFNVLHGLLISGKNLSAGVSHIVENYPQVGIDSVWSSLRTPLMMAVDGHSGNSFLEEVEALFGNPGNMPDVNWTSSRGTALYQAAIRGHEGRVEFLLSDGDADCHKPRTNSPDTPWKWAVREENDEMLSLMQMHCSPPPAGGASGALGALGASGASGAGAEYFPDVAPDSGVIPDEVIEELMR